MKKSLKILEQLIWKSELDDRAQESKNIELVKGSDGWMTHHLKLLKELLSEKSEDA